MAEDCCLVQGEESTAVDGQEDSILSSTNPTPILVHGQRAMQLHMTGVMPGFCCGGC
jgi:hypothetical protein